jgi:hypothetical protein
MTLPPSPEAQIDVQAIKARLTNGEQRRCPFDSTDCKVRPDEPCPVCGDVDDLDVPVEEHKPSRCVATNLRVLHGEALVVLDAYEAQVRENAEMREDARRRADFYYHELEAEKARAEAFKTEVFTLTAALADRTAEGNVLVARLGETEAALAKARKERDTCSHNWLGCVEGYFCSLCGETKR